MLKGIKELEELKEEAMKAFKGMRGFTSEMDAGPQYLAQAVKCTVEKVKAYESIASYVLPRLSAIKVDVSDNSEAKAPITTLDAINIIKSDPFAPASVQQISAESIIKHMEEPTETINLPGLNK